MKSKKIIFAYLLIFNFYNFGNYQDIIINNKIISYGSRDCESRYEAIKKVLNKYKRPITVLDIGASQGYFSFKIANDYKSCCVMIEGNYNTQSGEKTADQLEDLCNQNTNLDNIIFLKKCITPDELVILSESEHFDVVLALNVIHHFGPNWKKVSDAILNMGDNIIIETPPANDKNAAGQSYIKHIEDYLKSQKHNVLGNFFRQTQPDVLDTMFLFEKNKKFMQRIHWENSLPESQYQNYYIESDFEKKVFHKKNLNQIRDWAPGINLLTFKKLNGSFPEKKFIKEKLDKIDFSNHNDIKIWNVIIQGKNLIAIDNDDPKWNSSQTNHEEDRQNLLNQFKKSKSLFEQYLDI